MVTLSRCFGGNEKEYNKIGEQCNLKIYVEAPRSFFSIHSNDNRKLTLVSHAHYNIKY